MRKVVFLFTLLFSSVLFAANSPVDQLSRTSSAVIAELKSHQATLAENPSVVYGIVRRNVLPIVDVETMSRSVLGRSIWQKATSSEQSAFKSEFIDLVIHTYSKALAKYRDETVKFFPLRGGEGGDRVQVSSLIVRTSGPNIPMTYRLHNSGGEWKIYDFSVEGVSLVQSFRSQFQSQLSTGDLNKLIQRLKEHNHQRS